MKDAPKIITLGCRLNAYESDVMAGHARDAGLENTVFINTCAVTNEAVRQSRYEVRKARRNHPDANIIVTGCAAQINPQEFSDMPEVDAVIGNEEKMRATSFDQAALFGGAKIKVNDIMSVRETAPQLISGGNRAAVKSQNRTRAFLQVQNGCDHRCTFCIIPYGRGVARSVPAGEVVAHVKSLVSQGYGEVVLTGVDLSSWGQDLPGTPPLGDLVRRVLKLVPDLPRLRLSSIDPAEIDEALFEALTTNARMTPYLHLSLQAGDDMILKRMKRRHSRQDAIDLCQRIKQARPEFAFGADMIAGFPTEDETMFENSRTIISEIGIPWLHVFPYSAREGTPAAKMPSVKGDIIKARAKVLRGEGEAVKAAHIKARIGQVDEALFEDTGLGRLTDFTLVKIDGPPQGGAFAKVKLTGYDGENALGILHG
ncbi:MAG: tRNA (N(6)-L-threonylcarbamoyladenosine(37)-C(2))-methylthiotransferase MtaB [Hellea sp.]|nr:tRNA (N(6)-L-threonylcarbamoyladenosine(37)-C(2))-methylthiotransferase MtaB [Hellea sp.]